jgi:SAM-dependent methyltransferase
MGLLSHFVRRGCSTVPPVGGFGRLLPVATTDETWNRRARSFGSIAREYDRVRPSYPSAMIDDIVDLLPGREVVEIGAGTGKATVLLAARDLAITCVEPDPGMAEVLTDRVAEVANQRTTGSPSVTIVVSSFEDWLPQHRFDGLLAAQSWHWTQAGSRYERAAAAVKEDGILALFWNVIDWAKTPISTDIDEIYRRHGMRSDNARRYATAEPNSWPREELEQLRTFTNVEVRNYPWQHTYTATEWIDYMGSTSDHVILAPERRVALLADVRRVIEATRGEIPTFHRCDLYLARRTSVDAAPC